MSRGRSEQTSYFSLTAGGALMALKLRDRFGGTAHLPRCHSLGCSRCSPFDSLAEALPKSFEAGDTIVAVMAAGIVFRLLAPHLSSKQHDPAVIVLDEEGRHVIPLLGGHAAGANGLSMEIAEFLGGQAAVTTSSDVQGLTGPDEVARLLGCRIADDKGLRRVTSLLVDGKKICIESESDPQVPGYEWIAPGADTGPFAGRLLITHKSVASSLPKDAPLADEKAGSAKNYGLPVLEMPEFDAGNTLDIPEFMAGSQESSAAPLPTARLIPQTISVGVGCRRGTSAATILEAIDRACAAAGIDPLAICRLASADIKSDEDGILQAAGRLGAELVFYPARQLAALGRPGSDFVEEQVGTPAVAEPAAMLAAAGSAPQIFGDDGDTGTAASPGIDAPVLLSPKTAYGPVTVAMAMSPPVADGKTHDSAGRVLVVGTGAGTRELLTGEAAAAIGRADVVIGYRTYIEQLRGVFPAKKFMPGSMGREVDRCREAIDMARQGQTVAMVSSGDAGIYGMAGPLLELAGDVPIEVVPGITAAQIAAAGLGAPLMNDFMCISLSDLLTPRQEVLRRMKLAAASDLVVCLYNPTSRKRQPLFEEACAMLLDHRPPETVVGWVRDAGGPDEEVRVMTLGELLDQDTDMRTMIIVGNSRTEVIGGRMVTRRGYREES